MLISRFPVYLAKEKAWAPSQASPRTPLPSFSSWNLQTIEGWDICSLQVWGSCSKTKLTGKLVNLGSEADQGYPQYSPHLHPTPRAGAQIFLSRQMVTCWCQATGFILSGLVMPVASCGTVFIRANRELSNWIYPHGMD